MMESRGREIMQTMMQTMERPEVISGAMSDMHAEDIWQQVLARDATADGRFVYAVTTTGIVCRPSCPSRRPARENVRFFQTVEDALQQGYRACLRCTPSSMHPDASRVEQLCSYLRQHVDQSVTLRTLSELSGLSTFATQRLFERVMGVSPRRYQMGLRAAGMRRELAKESPPAITDALYSSGYSASSRLYADADRTLGMKPSNFRDGGRGESVEACTVRCALGQLLVARTSRGLCHIALGDEGAALEAELRLRFRNATVRLGQVSEIGTELHTAVTEVLSLLAEHPSALDLPLDLRATAFQQRVWQALRAIPRGETRSYQQVAGAIGQPTAARAVARACASNTLALVVPCHRVIGGDGDLRGYRWGKERKRQLLAMEKSSRGDQ
jgi:AraC family transcriptional regulator of adaptative response/methylated-DNA-[protein]-cysteine methyltransferase